VLWSVGHVCNACIHNRVYVCLCLEQRTASHRECMKCMYAYFVYICLSVLRAVGNVYNVCIHNRVDACLYLAQCGVPQAIGNVYNVCIYNQVYTYAYVLNRIRR
jgi:hypothetical protein